MNDHELKMLKLAIREGDTIQALESAMREAKYHRHVGLLEKDEFDSIKRLFKSHADELRSKPKGQ